MQYNGQCEADLTEYAADLMREAFNIEIEMLQGSIEDIGDGMKRYKFVVNEEKGELIQNFILRIMSRSDQINYN